jgi:uncharacterized protein
MTFLDLHPRHLAELKRILSLYLPQEEVWAYGSRVRGDNHETSALDLVVRGRSSQKIPVNTLIQLRNAFSESNIPILIEILDWARIPESFREEIQQDNRSVQEGAQSADKTR